MTKFNKGEWSELFVFLSVLFDAFSTLITLSTRQSNMAVLYFKKVILKGFSF